MRDCRRPRGGIPQLLTLNVPKLPEVPSDEEVLLLRIICFVRIPCFESLGEPTLFFDDLVRYRVGDVLRVELLRTESAIGSVRRPRRNVVIESTECVFT